MNNFLLQSPELDSGSIDSLLHLFMRYRKIHQEFFLRRKYEWETMYPGEPGGICAELDSISGEWLPKAKERNWTWGDGRAIGLWSYRLAAGTIPDEEVEIKFRNGAKSVNPRREYESYCELLREKLLERRRVNNGRFPFVCERKSMLSSPGYPEPAPENPSFSDLFCVGGLLNYAIYKNDSGLLEDSESWLDEITASINTDNFASEQNPDAEKQKLHGPEMIVLGVCVDALRTIQATGKPFGKTAKFLLDTGLSRINRIMKNFMEPDTGRMWEVNDLENNPVRDGKTWICDPGHAIEDAGFLAEFASLTQNGFAKHVPPEANPNAIIAAAANVVRFMTGAGYSQAGLMYKRINLLTGSDYGMFDAELDGVPVKSAPKWNVREHAAAALKLYELTGDKKLLEGYRLAQNAAYGKYVNPKLDGMMMQNLYADTGKPLPLNPATANIDPMHDGRARDREIEILKRLRSA